MDFSIVLCGCFYANVDFFNANVDQINFMRAYSWHVHILLYVMHCGTRACLGFDLVLSCQSLGLVWVLSFLDLGSDLVLSLQSLGLDLVISSSLLSTSRSTLPFLQ